MKETQPFSTTIPRDQPIQSCTTQPVVPCLTANPRRLVNARYTSCTAYARYFPSTTPFAVLPPFLRDNARAELLMAASDSLCFLSLMPNEVAYLSLGTVIDPLIAFLKHVNIRCCQLVESARYSTNPIPSLCQIVSTTYGDVAMPCSVNHFVPRTPLQSCLCHSIHLSRVSGRVE